MQKSRHSFHSRSAKRPSTANERCQPAAPAACANSPPPPLPQSWSKRTQRQNQELIRERENKTNNTPTNNQQRGHEDDTGARTGQTRQIDVHQTFRTSRTGSKKQKDYGAVLHACNRWQERRFQFASSGQPRDLLKQANLALHYFSLPLS